MKKIKVLRVEAHKSPEVIEIAEGLEALQAEVDGYIECIYPFRDNVGIVCNDEAKLIGLELNRSLRDGDEIYDIIAGTFLVVGLSEEDFRSLTDDEIQRYSEIYRLPEIFVRMGNRIVSITEDGPSEMIRVSIG